MISMKIQLMMNSLTHQLEERIDMTPKVLVIINNN
jgi:hypothetical protein